LRHSKRNIFFQARSADEERGNPTLLEMFLSRGCDEATAVVMALDMVSFGDQFHQHFKRQSSADFALIILILFKATAFGKIVPKYAARHTSCNLKHAV
jgi:hypothetical protein